MNAAVPVSARLRITLSGDSGPVRSVLLHPAGGGITPYLQLGSHLARRGPVAAIRAAGLMPGELPQHDVNAMVEAYAPLLAVPDRPDLLIGWSLGGVLAWELAARLAGDGPAPAVVLIDSATRADPTPVERLPELKQQVLDSATSALGTVATDEVVATVEAHVQAVARHRVTARHDGPALLLACDEEELTGRLGDWSGLGAQLRVERLPGGHFDVFSAQTLPVLLRHLDRFLDDTFEPGGRR